MHNNLGIQGSLRDTDISIYYTRMLQNPGPHTSTLAYSRSKWKLQTIPLNILNDAVSGLLDILLFYDVWPTPTHTQSIISKFSTYRYISTLISYSDLWRDHRISRSIFNTEWRVQGEIEFFLINWVWLKVSHNKILLSMEVTPTSLVYRICLACLPPALWN